MQRGAEALSGGLGPQLAGEKINVNRRVVSVVRQLGEGGFSFVYLVKDMSENSASSSDTTSSQSNSNSSRNIGNIENNVHESNNSHTKNNTHGNNKNEPNYLVLKITSIHSRHQRDIAEKEAKLLSRLSHPSIVRMTDTCYRSIQSSNEKHNHISALANIVSGGSSQNDTKDNSRSGSSGGGGARPQHLILMEYCEGGTALSVCNNLRMNNKRFDLPSLIIAFGQICNAVSYLHAQRPPIVHRDLKPVNFLVKNGAYKLCDFGSAVFGHVDLRTSRARTEAEEVIQKTTTQMFRSPEMVDLYMSKKLTQSTDVWALGCCLYSLAFFQNCFEEGSNLAILSRNYKIPEDNPYGDGLVDLIDRMLTVNCKERADMTEVILCLSAIYSGRPLPPRKRAEKARRKEQKDAGSGSGGDDEKKERVGAFRTDGQGIRKSFGEQKRPAEAKKLNPNSAAARRRKAAQNTAVENSAGTSLSEQTIPRSKQQTPELMDGFETSFSNFQFQSSNNSTSAADKVFGSSGDDPFQVGGHGNVSDPLSFENFNLGDGTSDDGGFENFGSDVVSRGSGFESFASSDDVKGTGGGNSDFPAHHDLDLNRNALDDSYNTFDSDVAASSGGSIAFGRDIDLEFNSQGAGVGVGTISSGPSSSKWNNSSSTRTEKGRSSQRGRPRSRVDSPVVAKGINEPSGILADLDYYDRSRSKSLNDSILRGPDESVQHKKKKKASGIKSLFRKQDKSGDLQ